MKQSKGLKGDLTPEHKNNTKRTTMRPTTGIGSQTQTVCKILRKEPLFSLRSDPMEFSWFKQYLVLIKFNTYMHAYMYKNNFQKPRSSIKEESKFINHNWINPCPARPEYTLPLQTV